MFKHGSQLTVPKIGLPAQLPPAVLAEIEVLEGIQILLHLVTAEDREQIKYM